MGFKRISEISVLIFMVFFISACANTSVTSTESSEASTKTDIETTQNSQAAILITGDAESEIKWNISEIKRSGFYLNENAKTVPGQSLEIDGVAETNNETPPLFDTNSSFIVKDRAGQIFQEQGSKEELYALSDGHGNGTKFVIYFSPPVNERRIQLPSATLGRFKEVSCGSISTSERPSKGALWDVTRSLPRKNDIRLRDF